MDNITIVNEDNFWEVLRDVPDLWNAKNLRYVENRPYYMGQITEAQWEEERAIAELQGVRKGKHEHAVLTARNMFARGFDLNGIADITALDIATIRDIVTSE